MKLLTHIPAWIKNKFFIAFAVFAAIMLFFDKNDVFTKAERDRQLRDLLKSKQYYTEINAELHAVADKMRTDPGTIEKYSREKFLMKRDNEDLFVIPENYAKAKN